MSFASVDLSIGGLLSCNLLSYSFGRAAYFQQSAWASWLGAIIKGRFPALIVVVVDASVHDFKVLVTWSAQP
jgi:hypothetical protein